MNWSIGSQWHRWDPHLHCPGTLFNCNYHDRWDDYFSAIERSSPPVRAIGVTDYCVLDGYRAFLEQRTKDRLRAPDVQLVFPNVEFRITIETEKRKGINLHLLFSPEAPDHIERIEGSLSRFHVSYDNSQYYCTRTDLIRLGKAFAPAQTDERGCLVDGAKQFKLSWEQLRSQFDQEKWLRENCLIAISGNSGDGTAGLGRDGQFAATREGLEAFADIIFSAQPNVRDFFLGLDPRCLLDQVERKYGRRKPCLHGSDAHEIDRVLKPDGDRYCWIHAEPTFSGLKQVLLEPEHRVWIGAEPPVGPAKGETIARLRVETAPWLRQAVCDLNPGLVAIIGPKGSGKTALADMIACCAGAEVSGDASFLVKAREHLGDASGKLEWADGETTTPIRFVDADDASGSSGCRVRYLSQKFVERLCSPEGNGDELASEVESVVFQATPDEDRLSARSFAELRSARLDHVVAMRRAHQVRIADLGRAIAAEDEKIGRLDAEKKNRDVVQAEIKKLEERIRSLMPKGKSTVGETVTKLQASHDERVQRIQMVQAKLAALKALESEVTLVKRRAMQSFDDLKPRYVEAGLLPEEWSTLRPVVQDAADKSVFDAARVRIEDELRKLRVPEMRADSDPASWPLADLKADLDKRVKEQGAEVLRTTQYKIAAEKIAQARRDLLAAEAKVKDIEAGPARKKVSTKARRDEYAKLFDAFEEEARVLGELYAPLARVLGASSGPGRQIGLSVKRVVDIEKWCEHGESLFDLRKKGAFQRRGALLEEAAKRLRVAWETKGSEGVAEAMDGFLGDLGAELVSAKAQDATVEDIAQWLFNVDHVQVRYAITFQGVELRKLSPGTRGVVLLMLYLAVDRWDSRPLVVDQPEENLDPQSVFDELVPFFRLAKARRQIILVTHNANLVVNADADQVIIAKAERDSESGLPTISYTSGALEDRDVRESACKILEGGKRAFLERETRYGLRPGVRVQPVGDG